MLVDELYSQVFQEKTNLFPKLSKKDSKGELNYLQASKNGFSQAKWIQVLKTNEWGTRYNKNNIDTKSSYAFCRKKGIVHTPLTFQYPRTGAIVV